MNLSFKPQRHGPSATIQSLIGVVLFAAVAMTFSPAELAALARSEPPREVGPFAAAGAPAQAGPKAGESVSSLLQSGKYAEAEQILRAAIPRMEKQSGAAATTALGNHLVMLARTLRLQNRSQEALAPVERGVLLLRKGDLKSLAAGLREQGTVLYDAGKYREAAAAFEEAIPIYRKEFPAGDGRLRFCVQWAAETRLTGKFEPQRAVDFSREYLAMISAAGDLKSDDGAVAFLNLAVALRESGSLEVALKTATTGLETLEKVETAKARRAQLFMSRAKTLEKMGRLPEARADYAQALAIREQVLGREHPRTREAAVEVARVESQLAQGLASGTGSGAAGEASPGSTTKVGGSSQTRPTPPATTPPGRSAAAETPQPWKATAFDAEPELTEAEVKALPGDIATEWRAAQALGKDVLWQKVGPRPPLNLPRHTEPAVPVPVPAVVDFTKLGPEDYVAAVTLVKEHYRMMLGAMDDATRARFNAKWAPFFANATPAMFQWLQAAGPLLAEFQAVRVRITSAGEEFDDIMEEVKGATAFQNDQAVRTLLSQGATTRQELLAQQARLAELTDQIKALGDPPNPIKPKARARLRHEDAVRQVRELAAPAAGCWVLASVTASKEALANGFAGNHVQRVNWSTKYIDVAIPASDEAKRNGALDGLGSLPTTGSMVLKKMLWWEEPPPRLAPLSAEDWQVAGTLFRGGVDVGGSQPEAAEKRRDLYRDLSRQEKAGAVGLQALVPEVVTPADEAKAKSRHESFQNKDWFHVYLAFHKTDSSGKIVSQVQRNQLRFNPADLVPGTRYTPLFCPFFIPPPITTNSEVKTRLLTIGVGPDFTRPWIKYVYHWDETGSSLQPFQRADGKEVANLAELKNSWLLDAKVVKTEVPKLKAPAKSGSPAPPPSDDSVAQQVKTSTADIALLDQDLASLRQRLSDAKNEKDRQFYQWLIMGKEANRQVKRDYITTLQTGNWTHTRTAWEDVAQQQATESFIRDSQRSAGLRRILHHMDKVIAQLPVDEQFVAQQEMQKTMMQVTRTTDHAAARKAAEKLLVRARTYQRNEGDRWMQRGDTAEAFENSAQQLKTTCDTAVKFLSMGGGMPVLYAYQGATGYLEGGPLQAVENVARGYSTAVDYAYLGYAGYQEGGAKNAVEAVGWQFAQNLVVAKVMGKLMGQAEHGAGDGPKPTVKEQFEAAKWKQEVGWGKAQVKQFEDAQAALMKAGQAGAKVTEIVRLQGEVRKLAVSLNSSPMAKNVLKYHASPATGKAFDTHMRTVYAEVDAATDALLRQKKWNLDELVVRDFRNEASFGKPNMDRDYGLDEATSLLRQGSVVLQVKQGGEHRSIAQFQDSMTKAYHDNYKRLTGYSADSAWQAITTTTAHNEAFKDVAVLTGNIGGASKGWAGQTADVIRYKADLPNMERANASFSQYTRQQESARGLAKEIQTKVEPALLYAKPSAAPGTPQHAAQVQRVVQTQKHMREVQKLCADFGQGNMDPLTFNQKLSTLTGGKSLNQVADQMGTVFEAAVKFKAK